MRKRKKQHTESGFSLTEMMVVLAVVSVFSIFLVSLIMTSQNAWLLQNASIPARSNAKLAMESIAKELREASLSAPGGIVVGGTNNSQITFATPNQVSKTKVLSWKQIVFSYNQANQQIIRTQNGATTTLGSGIITLSFTQPTQANNFISVSITARRTIPGGTTNVDYTLTSRIKPRN